MEIEFEIKTVWASYQCDKCNEGIMEYLDEVVLVDPVEYRHICLVCGHVQDFTKRYPEKKEARHDQSRQERRDKKSSHGHTHR